MSEFFILTLSMGILSMGFAVLCLVFSFKPPRSSDVAVGYGFAGIVLALLTIVGTGIAISDHYNFPHTPDEQNKTAK